MITEKPRRTQTTVGALDTRKKLIIAFFFAGVCVLLSWGGYRLLDRIPAFWVSKINVVIQEAPAIIQVQGTSSPDCQAQREKDASHLPFVQGSRESLGRSAGTLPQGAREETGQKDRESSEARKRKVSSDVAAPDMAAPETAASEAADSQVLSPEGAELQKKIKELADPAYGRCIFKVRLSDLHQKITSISWVKSLSIRRVMPSTLEIQVQKRLPIGIVQADHGQLYLVDAEGVLIDRIKKKRSAAANKRHSIAGSSKPRTNRGNSDQESWEHLPLITGVNLPLDPSLGQTVDSPALSSALQALTVMEDIKAQWLTEISQIEVCSLAADSRIRRRADVKNQQNIILYSRTAEKGAAYEIRLGANDDMREKLICLQMTWSSIQSKVSAMKYIEYIDLRYKHQLIVKPKKCISTKCISTIGEPILHKSVTVG